MQTTQISFEQVSAVCTFNQWLPRKGIHLSNTPVGYYLPKFSNKCFRRM